MGGNEEGGIGTRLLDRVRHRERAKHYSLRTEQTHVHWIKRLILLHGKRHPQQMGKREVGSFSSVAGGACVSAFLCDGSAGGRARDSHGAGMLGHADVSTTMVCTHVLHRGARGVISPLDHMGKRDPRPKTKKAPFGAFFVPANRF